jgi:lipoprotein-anchoring transpeptidase ErfK/SrfK
MGRFGVIFLIVFLAGVSTALAQDPQTTHVVQAGENLYRIGLQYGFTADELALANGITDPGQIYAGQVLTLPIPIGGGEQLSAAPSVESSAPAAEAAPAPSLPESTTHFVQPNEGLAAIARNYGVSMASIVGANNLSNPDIIYPGQILQIPNPTAQVAADYGAPPQPVIAGREIVVDLSDQKIYAYENSLLVREVTVSTGLPGTPTVQGEFNIYSKIPSQTMYGPGYYLPNVEYVMYFYQGYSIHSTYWHNNFGQPMSHGCVNLPPEAAQWFYSFAQVGTTVRVVQ